MGQLLYFFPGATAIGQTAEVQRNTGLDRVFAGLPLAQNPLLGAGPSGQQGLLVAHETGDGPALAYKKDQQTWIECASGAFWLGWEGEQPRPEDLRRADGPTSIYSVEMGDGNKWEVPTARIYGSPGESPIPHRIYLDREGNDVLKVIPKYKTLMDYATHAMSMFDGTPAEDGTPIMPDKQWIREATCECLAAMYRVSRWEIGALGLLRNDEPLAVLFALVDGPRKKRIQDSMVEAAKKNAPA